MDDDFPIADAFVVSYPCFIVRGENGDAIATHGVGQGEQLVMVLTDEDSLNDYRRDIGIPERGAFRFADASQLLAFLGTLPPSVAQVGFDIRRADPRREEQTARLWMIAHVRQYLAAQIVTG